MVNTTTVRKILIALVIILAVVCVASFGGAGVLFAFWTMLMLPFYFILSGGFWGLVIVTLGLWWIYKTIRNQGRGVSGSIFTACMGVVALIPFLMFLLMTPNAMGLFLAALLWPLSLPFMGKGGLANFFIALMVFGGSFLIVRRRGRSHLRSVLKAYMWAVLSLLVLGFLLTATDDISLHSEADTPSRAAGKLVYQIRSLKAGILASLVASNELPLGAFALDSSVVSDDLFPYMDTRLSLLTGETMIIISSDIVEKTIRSMNASSSPLYIGFYKHPALTGAPQLRKPGFFGKLFGIQAFAPPADSYRVQKELKHWAAGAELYKNAQGEPYDGGDTILMKVF